MDSKCSNESKVLKKNVEALTELANIIGTEIEEYKARMCFRESLIISKFENEAQEIPLPVGGMCLDVQAALDNKFVVYVSTKFNVNDSTGGSKITTWIDPYFYTIEEKRVEFITGKIEEKQSFYTASEKEGMFVTHSLNDRKTSKRIYSSAITNNYVSEGANFVLMRFLAMSMYAGSFEVSTMYINGDLCRNIYLCSNVFPANINNVKTHAIRIIRTIVEKCGIVHECISILTTDGHLVKQEWNECPYIIQLNPLQDPIALEISGAACGCDNTLSLVSGWQDDMELMSNYLDRRKLCEYKTKDYMDNNPELSDLLSDYVKTLLQHKPEKVLDFTIDYFMRYGN